MDFKSKTVEEVLVWLERKGYDEWVREIFEGLCYRHVQLHSLAAPDPKKIGSGESQYKKVWCHRNVGGTNQISPRQINDVTLVIDIVLVTIIACQIIFSL